MDTDPFARYVTSKEDIAYEYELQEDGMNLVVWKRYLEHKKGQENESALAWVYERCLYQLPGCDEMWMEYLKWRVGILKGVNPVLFAEEFEKCNILFGKAVYLCHQNAELWELYLGHVISQENLAEIRSVLNRALQSLRLEHHLRIWAMVIHFIETSMLASPDLADDNQDIDALIQEAFFVNSVHQEPVDLWSSHMLCRYVEVADDLEHALILLALTGDHPSIVMIYKKYVVCGNFKPTRNTLFDFYLRYLKSLQKTSSEQYVHALEGCLETFPDHHTTLVIKLATFHLENADFSMARTTLQDALSSTTTARAFSQIYDFLIKILEVFVAGCIREAQEVEDPDCQHQLERDLSYNMDLLEYLMNSHELLLNDLTLRQNVNNVEAWIARAGLFSSPQKKADVYTDAILKVDHAFVTQPGIFAELWCHFAQLYIESKDYDTARETFDRALRVPFRFLKDIEIIWTHWAEMELECGQIKTSINLLKNALKVPKNADIVRENYSSKNSQIPAKAVTFSSQKLWSLYIDLLESSCSTKDDVSETKSAYEELISLKLASPLQFLNYAQFLQTQDRWEESFRVYERAIATFPAEVQFEVWSLYLQYSLERDRPIETLRDLFEQALRLVDEGIDCPTFFILYSDLEHSQGLDKRAIDILARGCVKCKKVPSQLTLWQTCIERSKEYLGPESSRSLYEQCIQTLPNSKAIVFVIDFAKTEESLHEIGRARAALKYGAQLLPPGRNTQLWEFWNEFELRHGDKSTYKEMLRMKRELGESMKISSEKVSHEDGNIAFVASTTGVANPRSQPSNPDEISLDI